MFKYKIIFLMLIVSLSLGAFALSTSAASMTYEQSTPAATLSEVEKTYESIQQLVESGELSPSVGASTKSIYIEFRKSLVRSNAEAQIIDIEFNAAEESDEADWLYLRLSQIEVERDARMRNCLSLLKAIKNSRFSDAVPSELELPPFSQQDTPGPPIEQTQPTQTPGINWQTRELDIEIEIAPEDISSGERE